jgi:hypothetical protein
MTKSRMALLSLAAGAAAWPEAAFAQSAAPAAPATAEQAIAAYDAWYEEVTNGAGARTVRRCRPSEEAGGEEDIVVCGRTDSRVRVRYEPVPGEVHHIAGDLPSGLDALAADRCIRLCNVGVMIPIIPTIEALGRGLERLLHPD